MSWITRQKIIEPNRILYYQIVQQEFILSFAEVIDLWKKDSAFRSFFNSILADAPFEAFFWEVPSMLEKDKEKAFEFVLVKSNALASVMADSQAFQSYFSNEISVVSFPNLRGDAELVVPCLVGQENVYSHLAAFVRKANAMQQDVFWQTVGSTYERMLSDQPRWLSTAGLGVYWLHVRIDSRPKYYKHTAYR